MIRSTLLGSILVGSVLAVPAAAQDAAYPVAVVAGTCDDLGEGVVDLDDAEAATGRSSGTEGALPSSQSYTTASVPIADILDGERAVVVGDPDDPAACGNVGGPLDGGGGVSFGLLDQPGGAELFGVAYLGPAGDDPDQTYGQVSVFGEARTPQPRPTATRTVSATRPTSASRPSSDADAAAVAALIGTGAGGGTDAEVVTDTVQPGSVVRGGWRSTLINLERAEDNTVVALFQFERLSGGEEAVPTTDINLTDGSEIYRTVGIVTVDGQFERGFGAAFNLPFLEAGEIVRVPVLYFVPDDVDVGSLAIKE